MRSEICLLRWQSLRRWDGSRCRVSASCCCCSLFFPSPPSLPSSSVTSMKPAKLAGTLLFLLRTEEAGFSSRRRPWSPPVKAWRVHLGSCGRSSWFWCPMNCHSPVLLATWFVFLGSVAILNCLDIYRKNFVIYLHDRNEAFYWFESNKLHVKADKVSILIRIFLSRNLKIRRKGRNLADM